MKKTQDLSRLRPAAPKSNAGAASVAIAMLPRTL